jgi:hypothetical protein
MILPLFPLMLLTLEEARKWLARHRRPPR